jgi:hypothetical protein
MAEPPNFVFHPLAQASSNALGAAATPGRENQLKLAERNILVL